MARSLWDPEIFEKLLDSKKRQLADIKEKLHDLALDRPLRLELLEQMLYLERTLSELEAEYARRTTADSGRVPRVEWEEITPTPLIPAIKHIRELFRSGAWKCSEITRRLCFAALHPDTEWPAMPAYETTLVSFRGLVGPAATRDFDELLKLQTQPAIFKAYLDVYRKAVEVNTRNEFKRALEIALANQESLELQPVEWAKKHLQLLLHDHFDMVTSWIKRVCDEQGDTSAPDQDFEEWVLWTSWRAPKLIHMQPSGNTLYNSADAWTREDEVRTEHLLESLSDRFIQSASFVLNRAAGDAYATLASSPDNTGILTASEGKNLGNPNISDAVLRAKLEADLAGLGDEIRALDQRRDLSKGQALFRKTYLQHKQNQISVQIELLNYTQEIAQCERELAAKQRRYEQTQTPQGPEGVVRNEMGRQAGRLDGGMHRHVQPGDLLTPEQRVVGAAKSGVMSATEALRRVQYKLERAREKLRQLQAQDREWEISLSQYGKKQDSPPSTRPISKAPRPPTALGGRGVWAFPNATRPLLTMPPGYPNQVVPRTELVMSQAIRKFPLQTHTLDLCKYILAELTGDFGAIVKSEASSPESAIFWMWDLLRSVLVYNCDSDYERARIEEETRKSDEWLRFAGEMAKTTDPQPQPKPMDQEDPAAWNDVDISFLSDERVQIRSPKGNQTCNFAELGFADGRDGKPALAWQTLRNLAEGRGQIKAPSNSAGNKRWPQVEKRIQTIRRLLRAYFRITSDPIPFIEGAGYQARFKIGCAPSYET